MAEPDLLVGPTEIVSGVRAGLRLVAAALGGDETLGAEIELFVDEMCDAALAADDPLVEFVRNLAGVLTGFTLVSVVAVVKAAGESHATEGEFLDAIERLAEEWARDGREPIIRPRMADE